MALAVEGERAGALDESIGDAGPGVPRADERTLAAVDVGRGLCGDSRRGAREASDAARLDDLDAIASADLRELQDVRQRYRSIDELRAPFGDVLGAERVIAYCGAGVASASDAFALTMLGHPRVALYAGSLLEWCADPDMPLEIDTAVA